MNSWLDEDKMEKNYSSKEEENEIIDTPENEEDIVEDPEVIEDEEVKEEVSTEKLEELLVKYSDNSALLEKLDTIIELLNKQEPQEDQNTDISEIAKNQEKNRSLLTQYIKQNAEFQQQVRIDMNKENESLKKEIMGERLDPLLKGIALVYGEYYNLLAEDATEDKAYQKQVGYFFESLEDVLTEYGCEFHTTKAGEERSARTTKIKNPMVLTGDESLHRKVIKSFNPSISKGKKVLCPEFVSIYKFDETLKTKEEEETNEETMVEAVDNTETIENQISEEGED